MTEVTALKHAVSRWFAEKQKHLHDGTVTEEMKQCAGRAKAIAKSNPVAVETFLSERPQFEKAFHECIEFEAPVEPQEE